MKPTFTIQSRGDFAVTQEIGIFKVAVGLVVFNENNQILLTQRSAKTDNNRGSWEIIYGRMHKGENPEETAKREAKEEVGIDIELSHVVAVEHFFRTENDNEYLAIVFIARALSTVVKPQEEEVADWKWVELEVAANQVADYAKPAVAKAAEILKNGAIEKFQ